MELALVLNPNDIFILTTKGQVLLRSRHLLEAKQCFEEVLKMDPENVNALYSMGLLNLVSRRYDECIRYFDEVLRKDPDYISALNAKAYCLAIINRPEIAMPLIKRALDIEVQPAYLDTKAFVLFKLGKFDEALSVVDEVLERDPMNEDAFYTKGNIKFNTKNYDDALRCFNEALLIDPKFIEVYNAKALALSEKKKFEEAAVELKKAIEIEPSLSQAHENLIKITAAFQKDKYSFLNFWMKPKKRLTIPIVLGILGALLILYSINTGYYTTETKEQIINGTKSTTLTSTSEHRIPETYLVVLGLIVLIILAPEIKMAKIGPVELELSKEPPPFRG